MSKRTRRITIVLTALALLGMAGGGVYLWRAQAFAERVRNWRVDGLKLVEQGDYRAALYKLGPYLHQHPEDVEALRAYTAARVEVEAPRQQHLVDAMGLYKRLLELSPGDEAAQRKLMDLYDRAGFDTEAIDLADALLAKNKDDLQALRVKARALWRMRQHASALELAQRHNELAPDALEMQMMTLSLMRELDRPAEQLHQRARDLQAAYPDDRRFGVLRGYAAQLTGNLHEAVSQYEQAAEALYGDPDMLARLVQLYDGLNMPERVLPLLQAAADAAPSPTTQRLLIRRLWEMQQPRAVVAQLDGRLDDQTHSECLVLLALCQIQLGEPGQAQSLIEQLKRRAGDDLAQAWIDVLAVLAARDENPASLRAAVDQALNRRPGDPYLLQFLGEAQARAGQTEQALATWMSAARAAPAWPVPMVHTAQLFFQTGRSALALQAAKAVLQRHPKDLAALIVFAEAAAEHMDQIHDAGLEEWLTELTQRLSAAGVAEQRLLPIRLMLLVRRGETAQAQTLARAALAEQDLTAQTILRVLAASEELGLGLAEDCFAAADRLATPSMTLTLDQASWIGQRQGAAAGLAHLDAAEHRFQGAGHLGWAMARAAYQDRFGVDEARAAWAALIAEHREDRRVLEQALNARSVRTDRALAAEALAHFKAVVGEDSAVWRLHRARWLLSGEADGEQLAQATNLLMELTNQAPYLAEAQVLLSRCFQELGNSNRALAALDKAQELRPNDVSIALERARLNQTLGNDKDALAMANRIAMQEDAPASQRLDAALVLARGGEYERAAELTRALAEEADGVRAWLLNARLSEQLGDFDTARSVYDIALEKDPQDPVALMMAATFHRARGRADEADALIARLEQTSLDTARRELLLARHWATAGQIEAALTHYRKATAAKQVPAAAWVELTSLEIQRGQLDAALAVARQAKEAGSAGDAGELATLLEQAAVLKDLVDVPAAQPIVLALIHQPQWREPATATLKLLAEAARAQQPLDEVAVRLSQLSDQHAGFLELQLITLHTYRRLGQWQRLADRARMAAQRFPEAVEPLRLAAEAAAAMGRWAEALSAAQQWRQRSGARSGAADLAIAEAHLQLGQPDAAVLRLNAMMTDAGDRAPAPAFMLQARAHIAAGHPERAAALLRPRLAEGAGWRQAWQQLAVLALKDADTAAAWLTEVQPLIPADAVDEQVELARHWRALDERFGRDNQFTPRAIALLTKLASAATPSARAVETLAVIQHAQGNLDAAVASYRRALELDPDLAQAANNLANLFMERGGSTDEAARLARHATDLEPGVAAYQDTLATTLSRQGDYAEAEAALKRAIRLEPQNMEWYLNLGDVFVKAGKLEDAQELLRQLDQSISDESQLPDALRQRLEELRRRIAQQDVGPAKTISRTATPRGI